MKPDVRTSTTGLLRVHVLDFDKEGSDKRRALQAANYVDVVGFMPVVWRLYQAIFVLIG